MKKKCFLPVFALAAILLVQCSPAPREKETAAPRGIPAVNALIWLAPLVNKSDIASINGWPEDTIQQEVLLRYFDKLEARLLSELRRCEKYGLYTMIDDSASAGIIITLTLSNFTRSNDTVTIPVEVKVESSAPGANGLYTFKPIAMALQEVKKESYYHYVGLILQNYTKYFPYNDIARLFYAAVK